MPLQRCAIFQKRLSLISHFTARSQLGTNQEDILIAGRGKNERLYGGAGDDLLVHVDGGDYTHGGSGADIFAFRFNKKIRRKAKRGKAVNHVIEDFNLDEGDSICLSHIVTKSRHKNIDYRGTRRIKGTGIEARLVQGKPGTAQKEQEAFIGIEDGVVKTLGELPEISKNRQPRNTSRLMVYKDGNLLSNITLKDVPDSRSFRKQLSKSIFGKYSKTSKEVVSAEGSSANHLTKFSLTQAGIPLKGNGSKIDIGDHSLPEVSALLRPAEAINSKADNSLVENSYDNSVMNASANINASLNQPFKLFGGPTTKWDWECLCMKTTNNFPSYEIGFNVSFNLKISPKIILNTGNVVGTGIASWSPNLGLNFGQEVSPGINVGSSGGVQISGEVVINEEGLGKSISISPELSAEADYAFGHNGFWSTPPTSSVSGHSAPFSIKGQSIQYTENGNKDGITGVITDIAISPFVQFMIGLGFREEGLTLNFLETGPKIFWPVGLEMEGSSTGDLIFFYGPAKLDWQATLGDASFLGMSFKGPTDDIGIAQMGPSGAIPLHIS